MGAEPPGTVADEPESVDNSFWTLLAEPLPTALMFLSVLCGAGGVLVNELWIIGLGTLISLMTVVFCYVATRKQD